MASTTKDRKQRGGFALGLVVGLLVGLALALGVALYVTKVPVPFVDKVPQRSAEQDAAEAAKNRNWDPNAPLAGKPAPVPAPASAASSGPLNSGAPAATNAPAAVAAPASAAASRPARPATAASAASATTPASAKAGADPFTYYVQVAAYARTEDAEQLRAKLALGGMTARITERDQAGRMVYRVRLGPYERREEADRAKDQAVDAGYPDAALVRVAR